MALILGIESSCDETAAAVVKDGREVLSNVISGTDYTTYVKSGYKVKTFIFDSLTSAIPQMEHKEITIN